MKQSRSIGLSSANPTASAPGDATAPGSSGLASDAGHQHAREAFAVPAVVLGTAAAAGVAGTLLRSDATVAAFDATAPSTQAYGDAAAVGAVAFAARRDHKHAMPKGWTIVAQGALTGVAALDLTGIAAAKRYKLTIHGYATSASAGALTMQLNGNTGANYFWAVVQAFAAAVSAPTGNAVTSFQLAATGAQATTTDRVNNITIEIRHAGGATDRLCADWKTIQSCDSVNAQQTTFGGGMCDVGDSSLNRINIANLGLTFATGHYILEANND